MPFGRPLHQQEASLGAIPCSDVRAAASNEQPAYARAHTRTRHCACSLSGWGGARALVARVRRAALDVVDICLLKGHCASERPLPFGARPCSDMPAAASIDQPVCACAHTRSRHCAASSREEAQHARLRRAPCRAGWRRFKSYESLLRQRDGPLLPCAAVLQRASRGLQRAAGGRMSDHANSIPRALSDEGAARACGARTSSRAGWSRIVPFWRPLHQREAILGAIPCSDVPVAVTNEQPVCACAHTGSRHCAHSLSGGGAARALAA